jgi:hypothetical protein
MAAFAYITWGAALFFAVTWTAGLMLRPDFRLKSTIATITLWWLWIALAALRVISVFHLLWLMPLSLLVPTGVMVEEIGTKGKASVVSITLKSLVLWPIVRWVLLLPFSRQMKMHEAHTGLVSRLSLDEAILAHNELTYGGFMSAVPLHLSQGEYHWVSPKKVYRDVEVVTSLYEYIMDRKGTPISKGGKAKYRIGITAAMSKILRERTTDFAARREQAAELLRPYLLDHVDSENVKDRSNLDQTVAELIRAVR